jgi:serine/threonine protein kinase
MRLLAMIGDTLGHYRIVEKLGEGITLGPVYRAQDSKLGREVTIALLREGFTDLTERWTRLAQLLAPLNHPNIASVYGVEESEGVRYVVRELVSGETMAERLRQGPLTLQDALTIAQRVAEALEAAHERGVIHWDLNPGNIAVGPGGSVKVLPTESLRLRRGEPVGAGGGGRVCVYRCMSPEQITGGPAGKAADVWAFGCLLYEMLTGRRAFEAKTLTDTLVAILNMEPDWGLLPAATPAPLRDLLRSCLEKDPHRRLQSISEARMRLQGAAPSLE